jgi:hypothetical protein
MRKHLTSQQLLLADYMSEISERCYYASWMQNLEYALWDAVLHGQRKYGHNTISPKDIEILSDLSKAASAWITFDDNTEATAIDLNTWKEKFQKDVQQNPQLLKG